VAYDNYASRLTSVFEASHDPQDFIRAEAEYQKLLKAGTYTPKDLRSYGILHQYMMQLCRDRAESLFNRVIQKGPGEDPEVYWSTQRQRVFFLWELGRNQESIDAFLPPVEAGSREVQEWICLIQAYTLDKDYDTAWNWVQKAQARFPESATVHIYAGDLLQSMKRYDEAFRHWKRALEMEPQWCDAAYSMGFCYEELGDYAKAYEVWTRLADDLESRGFEAEVRWPRAQAAKCKEKMS